MRGRLLIVDDAAFFHNGAARFLARGGYVVAACAATLAWRPEGYI